MNKTDELIKIIDYTSKLTKGINPLTDEELPDDCILNNSEIRKYFFLIYEFIVENKNKFKMPGQSDTKVALRLSESQISSFEFFEEPIGITDFVDYLNANYVTDEYKSLRTTDLTDMLINDGLLANIIDNKGKSRRLATTKGKEIGILVIASQSRNGEVYNNFYNKNAQKYLLENYLLGI